MTGVAPNASLLDEPETGVKDVRLVPEAEIGLVQVIERLAANPGVDVAKLEKIIDLQERILRHQAESDFNAAFSEMQPDIPTILEKAKTDKGTYSPLEDIIETVRPILARHGFSLGFKTEWPDKATVKVVGILTKGTHSRRSEFQSGADQSGSKNAIQALASAVSYGKRYTTKDLLCIVTRGEDDDGRKSSVPEPPAGYAEQWKKLEGAATRGVKALEAAWASNKPDFKNYTVQHNKAAWEALKVRGVEAGQ